MRSGAFTYENKTLILAINAATTAAGATSVRQKEKSHYSFVNDLDEFENGNQDAIGGRCLLRHVFSPIEPGLF